jgi:hypothetical protein
MREVPRFIADSLSSHPHMKLVYLALGGSVGRLMWQAPKIKSKAASKLKDKGKGKATTSAGPGLGAELEEKGEESNIDESDDDDDYKPGLKLETIDSGRFYDIYGVHMWKKDILLGRL